MSRDRSHPGIRDWNIRRYQDGTIQQLADQVVAEEPLEIRISYGPSNKRSESALSITMRTPGDDIALATGFLFTEGIVHSMQDLTTAEQIADHVVRIDLNEELKFQPGTLERHFYTTSSCGVCGKASIDMVRQVSAFRLIPGSPIVHSHALLSMGHALREAQPMFATTGGIHACALFDIEGNLQTIKEDVGRHNAMDKLMGWALSEGKVPLLESVVVVSGRGGFELVQKSLVCGVPVFAAVGAPSSLALELAEESEMTVVGFLRDARFNVYTCPDRIID